MLLKRRNRALSSRRAGAPSSSRPRLRPREPSPPPNILLPICAAPTRHDLSALRVWPRAGGVTSSSLAKQQAGDSRSPSPPSVLAPCWRTRRPHADGAAQQANSGAPALFQGGAHCPGTNKASAEGAGLLPCSQSCGGEGRPGADTPSSTHQSTRCPTPTEQQAWRTCRSCSSVSSPQRARR